jgi:hypothetical protein
MAIYSKSGPSFLSIIGNTEVCSDRSSMYCSFSWIAVSGCCMSGHWAVTFSTQLMAAGIDASAKSCLPRI